MEVSAKIIIKSIEVNVEGRGSVTASVSFKVGNLPQGYNNVTRVSVPLTDELKKYIENVVTVQVGEIISREGEE